VLQKYVDWIADYARRHSSLLGMCRQATNEMKTAFPELHIVRGHVYTTWGQRGHFWCKTDDDEIVDPTAAQFSLIFDYEEWKPGTPVRIGKCMNCGEEIWEPVESLDGPIPHKSSCSAECERELMESLA
jgi:hypothetical protein